jgi:hypothetical protein
MGMNCVPFVSGPVFVFIWGGIYSRRESLLLWPLIRHFDYIDDILIQ